MCRNLCRLPCLVLAGVLLAGAGCASTNRWSPRARLADVRSDVTAEELMDLLAQFEDAYEATVREAAERIVVLDPDRRTRRLALLWQTRLLPMARDALNQDDPVHSLLDVWALCLRLQHYFHEGDGQALFGDQQTLAREAADRCVEYVERVAATILAPDVLDRAREGVDALALEFPLRGEFTGSVVRTAVQQPAREADVIAAIVTAPLAPFRAVEGIDRGAAAIQGFSAVASRMTETVHDLPELTRLQAELLLMEMEELETVQSALASFDEFARASSRLAAVAEHLPADLRREWVLAADELEQRQAGLQTTLTQVREVVERVNDSLQQIEVTTATVQQTAEHTARAGDAWTGTFQSITDMVASFRRPPVGEADEAGETADDAGDARGYPAIPAVDSPGEELEGAADRRGFDIREYTDTADALEQAAARLQDLTVELRDLMASGELHASLGEIEARVRGIVEHSRGSVSGLADHVAWRIAQLILLVFVLMIAYHGTRRFTLRKPAA